MMKQAGMAPTVAAAPSTTDEAEGMTQPETHDGDRRRQQVRSLAGRAGWNMADQVVSSGTNLLLTFLVARALTADGFGAFAMAFTVYAFLISAARSLISQPLVVRYVSGEAVRFRAAARSATGATTLLGLASGLVTAATGFLLGGALGAALVSIGIFLPGLLLQDMWRMVFVAEGRPAAALLNDVVWAVVQLAAVATFIAVDLQSASAMLVGWGGAAGVAAVVGCLQFKAGPHLGSSLRWLARQRDLLGYYAASFFSVMGASQLTMLLIGTLGEPADVGALRAAAVVLGPLNLLGYSLSAFAVPEVSRRQLTGSTAVKVGVAISAVMVFADVVFGGVLLALPEWLGQELLGDSWASAQAVLLPSLLAVVAVGVGFGSTIIMQARGFAKDAFWTSAVLAPAFPLFGLLGLHLGQAWGAAVGLALAQWIVVPVSWWRVLVRLRQEAAAGGARPIMAVPEDGAPTG